ncbi:plasmid pRiA4b ORF-3 family protein [Alloactinosynnema sp. L-07]|uniref:plasmid pRiA4b ORF-3 family protein n=1 Tax=Alloactinosynnema sp. L-07 TaxID=1653480 RepID=UPI00065F07D7|nr:plasmid pRiA4b ORF-3 family protein [Alloactinosynnema sp. L-07]CRK59936.1 plasmid pRiA4b ORF-3 family protein [Alloactinosynnema sp. L-07]
MSPVSRGRKRKDKAKGRGLSVVWSGEPEACDCPECSGAGSGLDGIIAGGELLATADDPIEAEMYAAGMLAVDAGADYVDALVDGLVPDLERRPGASSAALLAALGACADERLAVAASAAADRLILAGAPRPAWLDALREPVTVAECLRLAHPSGDATVLAATFVRAGASHALIVTIDEINCGEVSELILAPGEDMRRALAAMAEEAAAAVERIAPAEFRWSVEVAMAARVVHELADGPRPELDDDGPPFPVMALLIRPWLATLPESDRPKPAHPDHVVTVYQLKVALRGSKPPIWRRLEVPSDITLPELHEIIQVAFDWDDMHLHVFRTPFGDFGDVDAGLDCLPSDGVSLEAVAPDAGAKIQYVYDFGDYWELDITVEKVLAPDDWAALPRCTGGRRAAPPEDCGGVGGYARLVDILADPTDEQHAETLDWLGLGSAADFDPAAFSAVEVTEALLGE